MLELSVQKTCGVAHDHGMVYALEHLEDLGMKNGQRPASIWKWPEMKELAENTGGLRLAFHQRSFGTPYAKPTGVITNASDTTLFRYHRWPQISREGQYTGPLPRIMARPMKMGPEHTSATAHYPPLLNHAFAQTLLQNVYD